MVLLKKRRDFHYIQAIVVLLLYFPVTFAQDLPATPMVRVGPGYEFNEGIYMNTGMVKYNRPIPPARIVSDAERYDHHFYENLLDAEEIILYDVHGVPGRLKVKDIWGYAYNGSLYIQVGQHFHRLNLEGSISRFMASATTYEKRPLSSIDSSRYTPGYYRPYSDRYVYANPTVEKKIYLLDFENNTMYEESPESLEKLLLRDYELYSEYEALSRRQRKEKQTEYIQRFNERHPLYFPARTTD